MSDFDVVIHLRNCENAGPAVDAGLALAKRLDAHVLGLHVVALSTAAFVSPEAVAVQVNETSHLLEEARARAPWWRAQLEQHGVQGDFQVVQGDVVDALCHASRWSDLIIAERPCANPDAPVGWGIASRTVFGSSAPVVVVPDGARVDKVGEHMLVAWNASRESMLAIRGALPLLKRATQVTVLEGEANAGLLGFDSLPKIDLRAWLQRHGVSAVQAEQGSRSRRAGSRSRSRRRLDRDRRLGSVPHHRARPRRRHPTPVPAQRSADAGCALNVCGC